ncbi:hypothetical protein Hanom_Chr04g00354361 [Helianthus anomalus]
MLHVRKIFTTDGTKFIMGVMWLLVHFQLHMEYLMWYWFIEPTSNPSNLFLDKHTDLSFNFD